MKDFLFRPEQARTPLKALSGGERGRLMLARALAQPSNLLVLDEPTNDLDLETLDLLQEMLADYPGTLLLVSHDRDFLDRVATSVIASDGDGAWTEYAGGYSDMVAQRGRGIGAKRPRRTRAGRAATGAGEGSAARAASAPAPHLRRPACAEDAAGEDRGARTPRSARLEAVLSDPDLYRRDPKAFAASTAALERPDGAGRGGGGVAARRTPARGNRGRVTMPVATLRDYCGRAGAGERVKGIEPRHQLGNSPRSTH